MKKLLLSLCVAGFINAKAQVKDYIGHWQLAKVVTVAGDTQLIKPADPRYVTYNFEYNNTFTSFIKEKNEEVTGRWGFEFKTKTIKIKNPVLNKTKTAIGDYDIVISQITPDFFVEAKPEKKKKFTYYIYSKIK
jgi:hypothetical protein